MHSSLKKRTWVAAAAFILVAAACVSFLVRPTRLILQDVETGKTYASYRLRENDTFSVTFVHSVNQSPVTDYYRKGDGNTFILYATKYHAYGAGIPESWPEDAVMETSADGIYVTNLHIVLPDVTYIVGTVSDHTLVIGDETVSLRDLCGRNAEVLFKLKGGSL
ncbi:MAG: DUF1850 domain-containing protein [Clostridia bacterium]|nr:DUF1850 domain-containing protein [Oscillospiraceae bacterium]MBQ7032709.1 DUF1850 domain-containing protein [Clostridia bacterium]